MRYQAQRLAGTDRYSLVWPVTQPRTDYPQGYRRAVRATAAAAGYFWVNPAWSLTERLVSHYRTVWSATHGWQVQVFYVGRLRRSLRWAAFGSVWGRGQTFVSPRRTAAAAAAAVPVVPQWCWCRLPRLAHGGLDAVVADLAYRVVGRVEHRVLGVVMPLLRLTRSLVGAVGAVVRVNGRFTRRQRADHKTYRWGRPGTSTWSAPVVDRFVTVPLRFGAVGLTVLVRYESTSI